MIKVTSDKLAELLHHSPAYMKQLLHRNNVKMDDFKGVVRFIMKHRGAEYIWKGVVHHVEKEVSFEYARNLFDQTFCKEYFDKVKEEEGGKCAECKTTERLNIHHIDFNHFNNARKNLAVLCWPCHSKLHGVSGGQKKENSIQLLTVDMASRYIATPKPTIYYWIEMGRINVYYAKDSTMYVSHEELLDAANMSPTEKCSTEDYLKAI